MDALLNYYVMADMAYLLDNCGKNMLLATYDGKVWYPLLYDMDTSWGADWEGKTLWNYQQQPTDIDRNDLFRRLHECFHEELSDRYFELRKSVLSEKNIMRTFEKFENSIPEETFQKERERWGTEIPGYDISQIQDYLDAVQGRLDDKYTAMKNGE